MNFYVITHPAREVHTATCRDLRSSAGETHRTTHRAENLAALIAAEGDVKPMPCIKESKS